MPYLETTTTVWKGRALAQTVGTKLCNYVQHLYCVCVCVFLVCVGVKPGIQLQYAITSYKDQSFPVYKGCEFDPSAHFVDVGH